MKTAHDSRHRYRIELVKALYTSGVRNKADANTVRVWAARDKIDKLISQGAPQWPIEKINPVDLAILRLAVYELTIDKKEPLKVIIDEAIEIAKSFGSESSPAFVNGVLGHVVNS